MGIGATKVTHTAVIHHSQPQCICARSGRCFNVACKGIGFTRYSTGLDLQTIGTSGICTGQRPSAISRIQTKVTVGRTVCRDLLTRGQIRVAINIYRTGILHRKLNHYDLTRVHLGRNGGRNKCCIEAAGSIHFLTTNFYFVCEHSNGNRYRIGNILRLRKPSICRISSGALLQHLKPYRNITSKICAGSIFRTLSGVKIKMEQVYVTRCHGDTGLKLHAVAQFSIIIADSNVATDTLIQCKPNTVNGFSPDRSSRIAYDDNSFSRFTL